MTSDGYPQRVIDVVAELVELPAGPDRDQRLEALCGLDGQLRSRVLQLLAQQSCLHPTQQVLRVSETADSLAPLTPLSLDAPDQVGPYHLINLIGEGGMGSVYKAEQRQPVRRLVAIKLIKLGMDSRQIIARFGSERQALAVMNHPNIAKVFDAGITVGGRSYFAMEYVPGEPITTYSDRHRLSTEQRLDLFRQVCDAVQHAHHKGIIHRDLKPPNVLVSLVDGKPIPKVIDFGVAKAINQQPLGEQTFFTERGQLIGTPEYMSPEQAEMNALDVDTRSDVYSLGVLLYELLTGALPFDARKLRQASYEQIQRIIRETDPPRPSTRLSGLRENSELLAKSRGADRASLLRQLRGDLDWITMKALEKDRTRRYATPAELWADIERHLQNLPVVAGPPSQLYRLRKFVRRNRALVAGASAVVLALVLGVIGTSVGLLRESRQRVEAQQQRRTAEAATGTAQAVSDFLQEMLASADPAAAQGRPVLVLDVLDRAARDVGLQFQDRPLVEASVRGTIGATYDALGRYERALPQVTRAFELRRRVLGDDHPDTLAAQDRLAFVLASLRRADQAEPLARDVLERRRRVLGPDHADTLVSLHNLGRVMERFGRMREAEPIYRDALERRRRTLGPDHPDTLASQNSLAVVLLALGRAAEAEPLCRDTLERNRRSCGEDHPSTLAAANNLSLVLNSLGRRDAQLESMQRDVLERCRRVLGESHPDTLTARQNLVATLLQLHRADEAIALSREALDHSRTSAGDDDRVTLALAHELGRVLAATGRYADAEAVFRDVCLRRRRVLGDDDPETLASLNNLAMVLARSGRMSEAEPLFRDVVERCRHVLGPNHQDTIAATEFWGTALLGVGKTSEAEPILRDAMQRCEREFGSSHPQTLGAMLQWSRALYATGTADADAQAQAILREALSRSQRSLGEAHGTTRALAQELASRNALNDSSTQPSAKGDRTAAPSGQ